jgi:hypothetical protein
LHELERIVAFGKDNQLNADASKAWLQSQVDFDLNCQVYENTFLVYDPKSIHFHMATSFFWERYSLEINLYGLMFWTGLGSILNQ